MTGSCEITASAATGWVFYVGDLVGFAPSRFSTYDYDGFYYPTYHRKREDVSKTHRGAIGIVVEVYEKYGYHAQRYYKIKWSDDGSFSNEKHENLILISNGNNRDKD